MHGVRYYTPMHNLGDPRSTYRFSEPDLIDSCLVVCLNESDMAVMLLLVDKRLILTCPMAEATSTLHRGSSSSVH